MTKTLTDFLSSYKEETFEFKYDIIASGSLGNAIVYHDSIMVDCGVPFSHLNNVKHKLKLVLLTHIHTDHFNPSTLKSLAKLRPTLTFGVPLHLLDDFKQTGITNYIVLDYKKEYHFGHYKIRPIKLYHNVENYGYRIIDTKNNHKLIHATDTYTLDGIKAINYDAYFIEYNYKESDIQDIILDKLSKGDYSYEVSATRNHHSFESADKWMENNNINRKGLLVKLHMSERFKENI